MMNGLNTLLSLGSKSPQNIEESKDHSPLRLHDLKSGWMKPPVGNLKNQDLSDSDSDSFDPTPRMEESKSKLELDDSSWIAMSDDIITIEDTYSEVEERLKKSKVRQVTEMNVIEE